MKFTLLLPTLLLLSLSCNEKTPPISKPNIIYILADDLGYGELGAYGQKLIETPNIDALATNGMRFTQHYSGAPVCAPARCVLLTGQHTGHAHVRGNDEWRERGKVWDYQAMFEDPFLEGQRPLPDSIITIGEMLQETGYKPLSWENGDLALQRPKVFLINKVSTFSTAIIARDRPIPFIRCTFGKMMKETFWIIKWYFQVQTWRKMQIQIIRRVMLIFRSMNTPRN